MVSWFTVFKYIHVLFVIIWLGGGFLLVLLGIRASRANNTAEFLDVVRHVVYSSTHIFIPSAVIALVFGILAAWSGWTFDWLWIWIGLVGFAATFAMGALVLGPRAGQVSAMIAQGGETPEAVVKGKEILQLAKFDFVLLFVIVADMVLKPGWSNWITLIIMVLVLIAGGYFFIGDMVRPMVMARMGGMGGTKT